QPHARARLRAHLARGEAEAVPALAPHLAADDPSRGRDEPHERERRDALAAPRLPHEPEDASPLERERDAVDGARLAPLEEERRAQRADLEERGHDASAAGMASSGSTRGAGGGANSAASSAAFASTPS